MDNSLIYFSTASLLLIVAPGPDNLYLLAKSLADGARSGIVLALGLASGIVFHTGLVIVGVAALVQSSPMLFAALKYVGAAYLLFLAWNAWRETGEIKLVAAEKHTALLKLYRRGILMNVLNPKVLLFFLAFLPQFVNVNDTAVGLRIALLGAIFAALVVVVFSLIAVGADRLRPLILRRKNAGKVMGKVQAVTLAVIAMTLVGV